MNKKLSNYFSEIGKKGHRALKKKLGDKYSDFMKQKIKKYWREKKRIDKA